MGGKGRQTDSVFYAYKWGVEPGQTKHTWSLWKYRVLIAKRGGKQAVETERVVATLFSGRDGAVQVGDAGVV